MNTAKSQSYEHGPNTAPSPALHHRGKSGGRVSCKSTKSRPGDFDARVKGRRLASAERSRPVPSGEHALTSTPAVFCCASSPSIKGQAWSGELAFAHPWSVGLQILRRSILVARAQAPSLPSQSRYSLAYHVLRLWPVSAPSAGSPRAPLSRRRRQVLTGVAYLSLTRRSRNFPKWQPVSVS